MSIAKSIFLSLLFVPFLVFVQAGSISSSPQTQTVLPKSGLTPESPFYFFDKLGEALQEFFTFHPEGKARLQITFASERVAEIKIILETKGVEAKGLEVAQSRLQANLAKAANIVSSQKSKGKNVSSLASELDDKLEAPKSALAESFKEQKQVLEAKEDELKTQLRAAHQVGDTAKEEALAQELGQVKAQQELLELKEEDIEDELEAEEEKLEEEMEAQHRAEKAIREAEEEKQEMVREATEEGAQLPAIAYAEFDNFLSQAQTAFQAGNFQEARRLAKQAKNALEKMEKREEANEAILDAVNEKVEILDEAEAEGIELTQAVFQAVFAEFHRLLFQAQDLFTKENYQGAKQLAEQAEDVLEDVEREIEKLEKEKENKEKQAKDKEERKQEQEEKQQEKAKDQNNEEEER